ncbi:hypothetical protein KIL84_014416 [Mauremys mutica]|uniref:Uncharacterized protein n=1 Tax=Mauremys mutica TaxID=74926 RepID=A0A9D3XRA3_9SAUR|nr:hypothetical protein KIL84_014416 [Mauremys mutica]
MWALPLGLRAAGSAAMGQRHPLPDRAATLLPWLPGTASHTPCDVIVLSYKCVQGEAPMGMERSLQSSPAVLSAFKTGPSKGDMLGSNAAITWVPAVGLSPPP